MSKVKPTTKEQLIHYLINNIQLGTYDKRFLTNVQAMNIVAKKPLTSNQVSLLHKIVERYQRQLTKQELDYQELLRLPWSLAPVESSPQFTSAYVSLAEDLIVVHSPYKSQFVKDLRQVENAKWDKTEREWTLPYSERTLKFIINKVNSHFPKVVMCDSVNQILTEANKHSGLKIWNPTLVSVNDRLMVAGINTYLNNAIENIELTNDPGTLSELSMYGISIDKSVPIELPGLPEPHRFMNNQSVEVEYHHLEYLSEILASIKCNTLIVSDVYTSNRVNVEDLFKRCTSMGMTCMRSKDIRPYHIQDKNYVFLKHSFLKIQLNDEIVKRAMKIISIVNNDPVKVK